MKALLPFLVVFGLVLLAVIGAGAGLTTVFGIFIPYLAIVLFLSGFIYRVVLWARAPVPFRIPTTAGQQKSLPWIRSNPLESPPGKLAVVGRMLLEILFFRSLFRNTRAELKDGPRLVYGGDKWLWAAALAFHWAFLVIFIRHLRFFTEPVPGFVNMLEGVDGFFQVGVPVVFATDVLILAALGFLLVRRFVNAQVKYISLFSDYFPLFLLLGVVLSGVWLRHFDKTHVVGVKELGMGLLSFSPQIPEGVGSTFYVHLFLVSFLIGYFPISKLMHLGGVFMSPTRNLANNNRRVRHVNPHEQEVKFHEFDHWKEEFKEEIAQAGYKLEKD